VTRNVLGLHCSLASGGVFAALRDVLPEVLFHCPDLPGHGTSGGWDELQDFQTQALDLAMEAAPIGRFDVLGHSFGGCLALRLLADHPERVRSLVLIEPVKFAAADAAELEDHWLEMTRFDVAMARGDHVKAARMFMEVWGDGTDFDDLSDLQRAYVIDRIPLIPAMAPSITEDIHDVLNRLPAGRPPTLIVARHNPPDIVRSICDGLQRHMPQARQARTGSGHMIPLTDTGDLAQVVRDFWRDAAAMDDAE
tara:strand:- start:720 stop:1475 length:756 start_codon:yes stop_codon:yes gene_type:complete